jgi:stage IV sporulation protein B
MKRLIRAVSALFSAVVLGWYLSPQVYGLLHLPSVVGPETALSAPALVSNTSGAFFVRESGDERLLDTTVTDVSVSLFGIIPLKTVTVAAHARSVTLGGQAVGVILKTDGVQIVGFERIETQHGSVCPAISSGLKEGDVIRAVNGVSVLDAKSFSELCETAEGSCTLSCVRDGEPFTAEVTFVPDADGILRLGAWVRDSTSGIGTLSFYDRATGAYAALGHGVTDVDTQKLIAPAAGFLTPANILYVRKGTGGSAGELVGQFSVVAADAIGSIDQNTVFGISGVLTAFSDRDLREAEIASVGAAHKGDAYILSTVDGERKAYSVRVIRVDVQSSPETQGMMIEITDPSLLEKTGGIVQGMSGSPLIQDGKLIGVVTHVFLSQPTRGYCLYAEWMAEELLPIV